MVSSDLMRTIVGIIGNVISMGLFLSPVPTFYQIVKTKSVQNYKPDPYLATVLNCAMWVLYGMPFVHPDSLLVITINGSGLVLQSVYIAIFLIYSPMPKRKKMSIILVGEFVFYVVVVLCTLLFLHGTKKRTIAVGAICVAFNILMYYSPLTVVKMVIKTKSVRFMPFWLSLASLCNGVVWLIYGLIRFDPWIVVPNGVGVISGIFQLILYATYYKTTNWDKTTTSEVEMAGDNV